MWALQWRLCQLTVGEKREQENAAGTGASILRKLVLKAFEIFSTNIYQYFNISDTNIVLKMLECVQQ